MSGWDVDPHFGYVMGVPSPEPMACTRCGKPLERVRHNFAPRDPVTGQARRLEVLRCPAFVESIDHWCKPWYSCHGRHGHDAYVLADLGLADDEPSITCPQCGRTSYNPTDVKLRYCGACHKFHSAIARQQRKERRKTMTPWERLKDDLFG